MNTKKKNIAVVSAVAIALGSLANLSAEENPFTLKSFTKPDSVEYSIAMGSCGQGMCGGNMSGMRGGNMPQGIPPTMLPNYDSKGAKALIKNCSAVSWSACPWSTYIARVACCCKTNGDAYGVVKKMDETQHS